MSTKLIDFESFVEWDNSPFILFDNQGKILYLNNAAEILFGYVSKKELYDIALSYAPQDFGYKTTTLTLSYDSFVFYALSVGYENEEQISLRLYNTPRIKPTRRLDNDKLITTDINILLEANIALFKTKNTNILKLLTDQDLPAFKIDQNNFSKLLRKTLNAFRASNAIDITLKLLIGQQVIIENKKVAITQLSITANGRYADTDEELRILAAQSQIKCLLKENTINLEIPLIQ
jgi:nitrogen-specific signal transduction histidine kinase